MGGVLQYKWEAYCGVSLSSKPRSQESTARYKLGAYCHTNWRCTAVLFRQVVGVGVSETLPNYLFAEFISLMGCGKQLRREYCSEIKSSNSEKLEQAGTVEF